MAESGQPLAASAVERAQQAVATEHRVRAGPRPLVVRPEAGRASQASVHVGRRACSADRSPDQSRAKPAARSERRNEKGLWHHRHADAG